MTTNRDIQFWERVPVPERTRLVHTLVKGAIPLAGNFGSSGASDDLCRDILDVTSDITMSLWDYVGSK